LLAPAWDPVALIQPPTAREGDQVLGHLAHRLWLPGHQAKTCSVRPVRGKPRKRRLPCLLPPAVDDATHLRLVGALPGGHDVDHHRSTPTLVDLPIPFSRLPRRGAALGI